MKSKEKTSRWTVFQVLAGDKNAGLTREERLERMKRGEDCGTDPIHRFKVVVRDGGNEVGEAMRLVFERFEAKTSEDLPKPFRMERLADEHILVSTKGR